MRNEKFDVFMFAVLQMATETLQHAEDEKYFDYGIKKVMGKALNSIEKRVYAWNESQSDEGAKAFNAIKNIIKLTVKNAVYKDPYVLIAMLKDFQEGNVLHIDDTKHQKFIKQNLTKIA